MPLIENEIPTGVQNSTTGSNGNNLFGLANPPSDPTRVKVYSAGFRRTPGVHYLLSGQQIAFIAPYFPISGDSLLADYNFEFPIIVPPPIAIPAPVIPASSAVNLADPLGVDLSCDSGIDPLSSYVSGLTALCQRIKRRLVTPRGSWFWAPNECTDVRAWMNEAMTSDTQASFKAAVEREALREEEVLTANADLSVNQLSSQGQTVTVHLTGTTRAGPFNFVLAVTAVSLAILKAG